MLGQFTIRRFHLTYISQQEIVRNSVFSSDHFVHLFIKTSCCFNKCPCPSYKSTDVWRNGNIKEVTALTDEFGDFSLISCDL